jgi:drug/metabolite transporter (DMT)-like permease
MGSLCIDAKAFVTGVARQLTMMIYLLCVISPFPFVELSQLMQMNTLQVPALILFCINTIIGYEAFIEALGVWQAVVVSAVIALTPVFTFISMWVALCWWPVHFTLSELDVWAYLGAIVVVTGSMLKSLGRSAK